MENGFPETSNTFSAQGKKVFDLLRIYCSIFSGISVRGVADFLFEVGRIMHGMGGQLDEQLRKAGQEHLLSAHNILAEYHQRGADELANRALKNFGHEQLPFKRFAANTAWYYMMCVSHNLFEAFKEDVSAPVISVSAYADTFRRQLIDTAGKIVRHAGKLIMKVPRATYERLQLDRLFSACQSAPAMTG